MAHQSSELKKKISLNPHPKRSDTMHYRDLVSQNTGRGQICLIVICIGRVVYVHVG